MHACKAGYLPRKGARKGTSRPRSCPAIFPFLRFIRFLMQFRRLATTTTIKWRAGVAVRGTCSITSSRKRRASGECSTARGCPPCPNRQGMVAAADQRDASQASDSLPDSPSDVMPQAGTHRISGSAEGCAAEGCVSKKERLVAASQPGAISLEKLGYSWDQTEQEVRIFLSVDDVSLQLSRVVH